MIFGCMSVIIKRETIMTKIEGIPFQRFHRCDNHVELPVNTMRKHQQSLFVQCQKWYLDRPGSYPPQAYPWPYSHSDEAIVNNTRIALVELCHMIS